RGSARRSPHLISCRVRRHRRVVSEYDTNPVNCAKKPAGSCYRTVLCPADHNQSCWKIPLLNGLYKVEYGVNDAFGRSIMCMHDGKLLGGNSAFAHLGTYQEKGEEILAEIITQRHNEDPHYKPLMDTDVAAISVRGRVK